MQGRVVGWLWLLQLGGYLYGPADPLQGPRIRHGIISLPWRGSKPAVSWKPYRGKPGGLVASLGFDRHHGRCAHLLLLQEKSK